MNIYQNTHSRINWLYVIGYYLIAILIASPFNLGIPFLGINKMFSNFSYLYYLPAALGPAIASLIFWKKIPSVKPISVVGGNAAKSLLFCSVPIILVVLFGYKNENNFNTHIFGLSYAIINLLYAFLEELGWRGFLLNYLQPLKKNYRYNIVGVLWCVWHLRFHNNFDFFIFTPLVILGSYAICSVTEKTGSLPVAVGFHLLIILLTNASGDSSIKIYIMIITLITWHFMLKNWSKSKQETEL